MSYLSTSGNVGYSGIPQNISDGSCATQYKMVVEAVPGGGGDVTTYANDGSADDQTYMTHVNDYYHTKFKIEPNDLYTFHDSDVIASEITVCNTEDNIAYNDTIEYKKSDIKQEFDYTAHLTNGDMAEVKNEVVLNGHYNSTLQHLGHDDYIKDLADDAQQRTSSHRSKVSGGNANSVKDAKGVINNHKANTCTTKTASETFLDVFKREQMGVVDTSIVKTEPQQQSSGPSVKSTPSSRKPSSSNKSSSASKSRRGRGPALHEALQRIPSQRRAVVIPNRPWHAPGDELFDCGPLMDRKYHPFHHFDISSSDDEELMPSIDMWTGSAEESGVEDRGMRLALRRAALRRQVAQAAATTRLAYKHDAQRALVVAIKRQLNKKGHSAKLPSYILNHLLARHGMTSILSSQERRKLRTSGWSGGESSGEQNISNCKCAEEACDSEALPCGRHCLTHVTLASEQRLYAACAAVFAGGARCKQPLLPLHDQTLLCAEHAWKRDNYDKISRECKPKKAIRKRVCPPNPRRAKRRRRPPTKTRSPVSAPPSNTQTLSELNVCSNSSTYDSEDTGMGSLNDEFIVTSSNSHGLEVEEVGHVPPDDILDSEVLSQIPDEAFTEFFNHSEGGPAFDESEELTRVLEAVLDERALDTIADCVFTPPQQTAPSRSKIPPPASVVVEMSGTPS